MAAIASGKDKLAQYLRIMIGGYDLSGDARGVGSFENVMSEVDMTAWNNDVMNFLANGVSMTKITGFQAFVNDDTAGAFTLLKDAPNQSHALVMFGGGGEPSVPDPAFLLPSVQFADTAKIDSEAMVIESDFGVDAESIAGNSFAKPFGWVLANSTLTATTGGASHDNGASTANGLTAIMQVLTAAGVFTITVDDSPDDSAWSTLATFTLDGSAIGSELVFVTGTIERYVRITATRTSGTIQLAVGYARN